MRTFLFATALTAALGAAAPSIAQADADTAAAAAADTAAADADAARYADAEQASPDAAEFIGGGTLVIFGSTATLILALVLLVVLL